MSTEVFKVAAIQAAPGQIAGPVADLDGLERMTAQAARLGARLVAWPECAYPAYFLRSAEHYRATAPGRLPFDRLLRRLGETARRCQVHLVAGVVEEANGGRLANAAILFAPDGCELARYRKQFLWHFDNDCFTAGRDVVVAQTELGRIGLMICADGRMPELAAEAARRGAQLLVNPTAWVSWGASAEALTNPQVEYMIAARAMETGCWILSANKVGVEAGSIVYCGRSHLTDPAGRTVVTLGPSEPGVLIGEVDLSACRAAPTGDWPPILLSPTPSLPVSGRRAEPCDLNEAVVMAVAAGRWDAKALDGLVTDLAAQAVRLLILPASCLVPAESASLVQRAADCGIMVEFAAAPDRLAECGPIRLAVESADSFVPARAAMLAGCELFVARSEPGRGARPDAAGRCPDLRLLRTRAAENRIYVAAAADEAAVVVSPTGAVLAESLTGRPMAVVVRVVVASARDKQMAPGTDVVTGRRPELYQEWFAR